MRDYNAMRGPVPVKGPNWPNGLHWKTCRILRELAAKYLDTP